MFNTLAGLTAAAVMGLTPMAAFADTQLGMYQTEDRLEDYQVSLCGAGDKFLCVKLLALRGKAYSDRAGKLIGSNIVDQAKPAGANKWKGKITIEGKTADSTLTLRQGVALDVHACAYVVLCASISLPAAKK
jgi:uncharacterized protein (DUF2147 family)